MAPNEPIEAKLHRLNSYFLLREMCQRIQPERLTMPVGQRTEN
jgi:hypothetical protein